MALNLIEIKDFPRTTSVTGAGEELMVVSKADGKTYGIKTSDFKQFLGTVTSITPKPLSPTDPSPTQDGVYIPTVDGTYANAGGLKRETGSGQPDYGMAVEFIKNGAVWVKSNYPLPIQQADGIIESGNNNAVSGGEVYNKTPETIVGKNLFDDSKINADHFVSSAAAQRGMVVPGGGWGCSEYIRVKGNTYYTLSGDKPRKGLAFYDEDKQVTRYIDDISGTWLTDSDEAFIVFNLYSPVLPDFSDVQLEEGQSASDYEKYNKKVVKKEFVERYVDTLNDISVLIDKVSVFDITSGTNKLNPYAVLVGQLLVSTGNPTPDGSVSQNYNTSDFITVKENTTYTGININGSEVLRVVCFYNYNKELIIYNNGEFNSIISPPESRFMRVSVRNIYPMGGYGIFEGDGAQWDIYKGDYVKLKNDVLETKDKSNNAVATILDVNNISSQYESGSMQKIDYSFDSDNIIIRYGSDFISGNVKNRFGYTRNDMFNFSSWSMNGLGISNTDDVAPMHILGTTLGANHGQPMRQVTAVSHGLTNTSIGTEWLNSSGVRFYIMRIVNDNILEVIGQNNGTSESPSFAQVGAEILTRGSETLVISSSISVQIYPSISNLNIKVLLDGIKEINDGEGSAGFIDVVESYDIMSPDDILNNAIARAGTSGDASYVGESVVKVENIYRFLPSKTVVVMVRLHYLKSVAFDDAMGAQSARIGTNGAVQYYIPNSNPILAGDFRKPSAILWDASTPSGYIVNDNMPDPENPPNRIINYVDDLGFSLGYITNKGVGKDINSYSDRSFEIRNNTGKIYPHFIEGTKVGNPIPKDSIFNVVMFRSFTDLNITRSGNRLSYFTFPFESEQYVYVDYSGSMIDKIDLNLKLLNGKSIAVLEKKNAELKSDTYQDGFYVNANYIEGETCYIVVKL